MKVYVVKQTYFDGYMGEYVDVSVVFRDKEKAIEYCEVNNMNISCSSFDWQEVELQ
jgi:hypothetical protein